MYIVKKLPNKVADLGLNVGDLVRGGDLKSEVGERQDPILLYSIICTLYTHMNSS